MIHLRKAFLWTMIVSLGLDAVLGIAALLLPRYGPAEELLGSAALFAAFSLIALLCAIVLEKSRLVHAMWAGIACAGAGLVGWLVLIWFERSIGYPGAERIAQTAGTFTVPAVIIAQCGLISLPRFDQRWASVVRWTTAGISALLALFAILLILWGEEIVRVLDDEFVLRGMGVMIILALCGTVITPILWKVQAVRRAGAAGSIPVRVEVTVVCPRCRAETTRLTGPGTCTSCGLRITVEVEEPRCPCGYLLHNLTGDRCPECGRRIPEKDRWRR